MSGGNLRACRGSGLRQGTDVEVVPLTREEHIEERCGRLLLVGCSNPACDNREWAHRWDGEPQVDLVTGRCGHKMRDRLFRAVQRCSSS